MQTAIPRSFENVGTSSPQVGFGQTGDDPVRMNVGGFMEVKSLSATLADERDKAMESNTEPLIVGLAGHIRKCWEEAKAAKEQTAELMMLKSLRQRDGIYDPDMLAKLKQQGSSPIYMLLTGSKCRSAAAWLREALGDMPWGCEPTPVADVDDATKESIMMEAQEEIVKSVNLGVFPSNDDVRQFLLAKRDQAFAKMQETAKSRADRMTLKMKDQLIEGHFQEALDAFIDDLVTFPAAILKGPVVRVRPQLKWTITQAGQTGVNVQDAYRLEWERVDPFNIYPAPDSVDIDDGYLIERHRLSRAELSAMRDVEGYNSEAIDAALTDYSTGRTEWVSVDSERITPENKAYSALENPSQLIDALQFWGSVQGQLLLDWGLPENEVEDPLAEYNIEAWLVGNWVIKAIVNPDPLGRRPYYKTSWECIPGRFWGKSIPDLCRDTQAICNAAARALVNNMSIASGPQVAYDVSRLPQGENLTEMHPWKIWQFEDNGLQGTTVQPINFFQPQSIAQELMQIYEKFAVLTDEYTGIPRYMSGDSRVGGAGSTASGMSMLMSNAGKSIKNVIASVDRILKPAIERLYFFNMMYLDDPELKGDVNIVARGVQSMLLQQNQQQKQLEAFNLVASNPMVSQMIGPEGMAYMLREVIKPLGMDTDRIIPDTPILKARMAEQQIQQMMAAQQQLAAAQQMQGNPQAGGSQANPNNQIDQRRLMDGSPQSVATVKPMPQAPG